VFLERFQNDFAFKFPAATRYFPWTSAGRTFAAHALRLDDYSTIRCFHKKKFDEVRFIMNITSFSFERYLTLPRFLVYLHFNKRGAWFFEAL